MQAASGVGQFDNSAQPVVAQPVPAQPATTEPEPTAYDPYDDNGDWDDYGLNWWGIGPPPVSCRDDYTRTRGYDIGRNGLCPYFL